MSSSILPITVAIPVRNEQRGLAACLVHLKRFARVMVIDSGSTDNTCDIARAHGAEVLQFVWDGHFPKKRNWFLRTHAPTTPWVLFLDADELLDDVFCDELARTLGATTHAGFWLTYDNWFLGKRLRHGTPNRKLALFRVGAGEYERIDEARWSKLDMEIHEHPILQGTTGDIHTRIDHCDDRGLEHWKRRHDEYAAWEARRCLAMRHQPPAELSSRQKAKYALLDTRWLPILYFIDDYFRRLGCLDGWAGFQHARHKAAYFSTIRKELLKLDKSQKQL